MKKLITLLLLFALLLSLVSCLNEDKNPSGTEPVTTTATTTTASPTEYIPPSPTAYSHSTFGDEFIEFEYSDLTEDGIISDEGWLTREDSAAVVSLLNNIKLEWNYGYIVGKERFRLIIGNLKVTYYPIQGVFEERYMQIMCTLSEEDRAYMNSLIEPYINATKNFSPSEDEIEEVPLLIESDYPQAALAEQIKEGMTYSQVIDILSSEGAFWPRRSENIVYKTEKVWALTDKYQLRITFKDPSPDYTDPYDLSNMDDWVVETISNKQLNWK